MERLRVQSCLRGGVLAAVVVGAVSVRQASAQITNSAHDFSSTNWSSGEICKPCHTPHFANVTLRPLWNHALTSATYQIAGGVQGAPQDFDVVSRLCMSCHDGTVALDSFGGTAGSTYISRDGRIGTDLRDDHPIGRWAQYPPDPMPSYWSSEFRAPGTLPPAIRLQLWQNPNTARPSPSGMVVGCTTCHDPHNRGYSHLLTLANNASQLCLTCHIK